MEYIPCYLHMVACGGDITTLIVVTAVDATNDDKVGIMTILSVMLLTHWGRMTHLYVSKLTRIGSHNRLAPWPAPSHYLTQCWDIVNSNPRNWLRWILSKIHTSSFKKMHLKMSSAKWRQFCLGLNVASWNVFIPTLQGCFPYTGAIIGLHLCRWSNPAEYG